MEYVPQSAYDRSRLTGEVSLEGRIRAAMYRYLVADLGLPESVATSRADLEVSGRIGVDACDDCERAGIRLNGLWAVDLGAGLGGLSIELARRGARVIAIEPGSAWRELAAGRLGGSGQVIASVGERLPLADDSVDLIVSLQVLEHVRDPERVIGEAFRILKPGGHFYLTYENYLSFWEPHYRVRWLPLLPKPVGTLWLRAQARNPRFLLESVTYTTFPAVRRAFAKAGFECMKTAGYREALKSRSTLKWRILRAIPGGIALRILWAADYLRRLFRTGIEEFMVKPGAASRRSD